MDAKAETQEINYFNKIKGLMCFVHLRRGVAQRGAASTCQCAAVVITTQTVLMVALSHAKESIQLKSEEMALCNAHTPCG